MIGDRFDRISAWFLVGFGVVLLILGGLSLTRTVADGDWPGSLVVSALLVLVVLGTRRGLRRLTRRRPGPR